MRILNDKQQKKQRGQATVEFALILLVLLTVLYGIIETSRLLLINAEIQNAAREGAHYAALHPMVTEACLKQRAIDLKLVLVDRTLVTVSRPLVTNPSPNASPKPYQQVQVIVKYPWTTLVNIVPLGSPTLLATSSALVESLDSNPCPLN